VTLRTEALPRVSAPFDWRASGAVVWLAAPLGQATAAFSTRHGGVSEGPFRSLNLGILTADEPDRVRENRLVLASAVGRGHASVVMGRQVHGTGVAVRDRPAPDGAPLSEADAQVTSSPELTPLVLVADCVPVVLAAPDVVAAVHCGWRGAAAGILERAIGAMGDPDPAQVRAALGPGIGPCCYAVGDEVREAFRARGHDEDLFTAGRLDLPLALRRTLERWGMETGHIHDCALCTSCNPDLFFSHRRDGGVTGRQAGVAWLAS
jgi:polyphenol oxidase